MSTHQQADLKLGTLKARLEEGDETVAQYYQLNKQILFVKTSLKEETWKVVIPTPVSYTHLDVYKRQQQQQVLPTPGKFYTCSRKQPMQV